MDNPAKKKPEPFIGQAKNWWVEWKKPLGLPECPYAYRWLIGCPWFSIRLHHWIGSDDHRAMHDHPSWFATLVLKGGYKDVTATGEEHLTAGCFRFRRANHTHTVKTDPGGCWTLLVFGREVRYWGFWVNNKFRKANRYFATYGHHPCDE